MAVIDVAERQVGSPFLNALDSQSHRHHRMWLNARGQFLNGFHFHPCLLQPERLEHWLVILRMRCRDIQDHFDTILLSDFGPFPGVFGIAGIHIIHNIPPTLQNEIIPLNASALFDALTQGVLNPDCVFQVLLNA